MKKRPKKIVVQQMDVNPLAERTDQTKGMSKGMVRINPPLGAPFITNNKSRRWPE